MANAIVPFRTQAQVAQYYFTALTALNNSLDVNNPSDWYWKGQAIGSVGSGLSQDLFILQQQIFPQTASGISLDSILANLNLTPRLGNLPATGQALLTNSIVSNVTIPQGQIFTNSITGVQYSCTQTTVITSSTYTTTEIPIACTQVGSGFNLAVGTTLTPATNISGVTSITVTVMTDGLNAETDSSVAQRIIFAFQNPPGGGSLSDFVAWGMETQGVTNVYGYITTNAGINIINIVIFAGGFDADAILASPTIPYSRTASNALITQSNNYIQSVRPINNTVNVITTETYMVPLVIQVTVTLATGFTLSTLVPTESLTVLQLIQREVRRAIITIPPGGVNINGSSVIPLSTIEQSLDEGLSSSPNENGLYASLLVDRAVLYNGAYSAIPVPSGSAIIDIDTNEAQIIYDVDYSNINVILS